jgi:hypothetical protein
LDCGGNVLHVISVVRAGTGGQSGPGHALPQAAFFEEVLFESPELLVEQVVGLLDQAKDDVGDVSVRGQLCTATLEIARTPR